MNGIFIYKQNNHDTTGNSVMLVILSMYVFNRLLIFSIPLSFVRFLRFFTLILIHLYFNSPHKFAFSFVHRKVDLFIAIFLFLHPVFLSVIPALVVHYNTKQFLCFAGNNT